MKPMYVIAAALVVLIVIVGSIFAYTALSNPSASPSPSVTPSAAPTNTPAATAPPTAAPTATPTVTVNPTIPASSSTPAQTVAPTTTPVKTDTPITPVPTVAATPTPVQTASPTPVPTPGAATLNGAGATFPQPFLNATIVTYTQQIRPNLQINYQGVGSGTGIASLTSKTVDFAASDAPLTDSQRAAAPNVLHIPETIGAVTLAYNLPGISSGLKLSGQVLADIYLGTITNWNDPAIAELNPDITLPNHGISTVHRSDSSGTTNIFTKYLANVSSTWDSQIGSGTSVQWPGANVLGASGNSNVAATVTQTEYAIGYIELAYALQNNMAVAAVQNPAGNFITPSLDSTTIAVQSGASQGLPTGDQSWTAVSLLNTADPQAYPIVSFTYMLVYKELNVIPGMTQDKATQLVQYLWYVVHDGQQLAPALEYAPLPSNVVQINEATLQSITYNGQTLPIN